MHTNTATQPDFTFVDDGRTFTCRIKTARAVDWWWFSVSSDAAEQWYAPFRAETNDTTDGVRSRVLAYYENRLARCAEPPRTRWQRTPRTEATGAPATPAADA